MHAFRWYVMVKKSEIILKKLFLSGAPLYKIYGYSKQNTHSPLTVVEEQLQPIFRDLAHSKLLEKKCLGRSQNLNE